MRYLGFLLLVAVVVYTVTDIINAPDEDLHGLPRGVWLILVILIPVLGSVVWFVVSINGRRTRGEALGGPRSGPRTAPGSAGTPGSGRPGGARTGPVAPDDDPEFLWRLEQERRRRAAQGDPDDSTPPTTDDEVR